MDAGFLSVIEIGHYFMTKDIGDLTQFHAVTCREYTLPRDGEASQPRGWIQRNTKNGQVSEIRLRACRINATIEAKAFCTPIKGKKQSCKEENLLIIPRTPLRWMKESGLTVNQENLLSLRTRFRRKWSIFFDTLKQYNEKTTEHFNSRRSRIIFKINFHKKLIYWSDDAW